jgi:hypothetical protein
MEFSGEKMNAHTCGTKIRLSEQINVFTVTLLAKQFYAGVIQYFSV